MVINQPSMRSYFPADTKDDVLVTDPLVGPHGDKGTLIGIGNIMMYKESPSIESTEQFLLWYMNEMRVFWQKGLVATLPVRKSFLDMPEIKSDPTSVAIANKWQPVARILGYKSPALFPQLNAVDGGVALQTFTQGIVQAKLDAKGLLTQLQQGLEKIIPAK